MLVILDRDGVINQDSENYIKSPKEWIPIEGSLESIAKLNHVGHTVVVATNQSGIARGYYTREMLNKIHEKMSAELSKVGGYLDGIYFCPHHPEDGCNCRKPRPGLLLKIKKDFAFLFKSAIFVGDSLCDIQAAKQVGVRAALVKTGNGQKALKARHLLTGIPIYSNLYDFVSGVL